jgi:hypothetical protein
MDNEDLTEYQTHLCQIIVEKRRKHQNMYKCVSGTIEIVNNSCFCIVDTKGLWMKIPVKSIRGIQVNEEHL